MNKAQAIHNFWSTFLTAYDQNAVPKDAHMPYITYSVSEGAMGDTLVMNASLWYESTSWKDITLKADEIAQAIGSGYHIDKIDGGYMWITRGTPFAQRMSDPEYGVRRIYLNVNVEFLTAY